MLDVATAFAHFPMLQTQRFALRAVTLEDTTDIFRIMSDARVMRYFGEAPMTSIDQAAKRVQGLQAAFEQQHGVRWAITRRDTDQFIGTCGFWRLVKPHFRAEIGYELAPECWGQGVMTEAVAAALTFGFTTLGLHSVEAQITPANTGSRRVLEKLGFAQEGYFHENYYNEAEAQFEDTAVFSLLQTTWMGRADHSA